MSDEVKCHECGHDINRHAEFGCMWHSEDHPETGLPEFLCDCTESPQSIAAALQSRLERAEGERDFWKGQTWCKGCQKAYNADGRPSYRARRRELARLRKGMI